MQVGVSAPVRPGGRDPEANRQRVLEVARELFAASGVDAVTMDQIARAAQVGPGTLYRRYAHKGALCEDLLRQSFESFQHGIEDYLASSGTASAVDRLKHVLSWLVTFTERNAELMGAINDALVGARRTDRFHQPHYLWLQRTLTRLIRAAVSAGDLHGLEPTYTADALLAALRPDLFLFQRKERGYSVHQIQQGVLNLLTAPAARH